MNKIQKLNNSLAWTPLQCGHHYWQCFKKTIPILIIVNRGPWSWWWSPGLGWGFDAIEFDVVSRSEDGDQPQAFGCGCGWVDRTCQEVSGVMWSHPADVAAVLKNRRWVGSYKNSERNRVRRDRVEQWRRDSEGEVVLSQGRDREDVGTIRRNRRKSWFPHRRNPRKICGTGTEMDDDDMHYKCSVPISRSGWESGHPVKKDLTLKYLPSTLVLVST